jgi:cellobiose phosphorylase
MSSKNKSTAFQETRLNRPTQSRLKVAPAAKPRSNGDPKTHISAHFTSKELSQLRLVYLPLSGTTSDGLKSSITPFLSGDIKIDKNSYLTKPASREDLRLPLRNFFVTTEKGTFSLAQESQPDSAAVEIGLLWHKLTRKHPSAGLELEAINFVPVSDQTVELMSVIVRNTTSKNIRISPTFAMPIFGRALSNKHDHEHVTALLNRTKQLAEGVIVEPTMLFNEEGHKASQHVYYVFGANSIGSFPTVESFCGEGGNFSAPEAVLKNRAPRKLSAQEINGKEAMGGLRFKDENLKPGATKQYLIVMGIARNAAEAQKTFKAFQTPAAFDKAFRENKVYWYNKTHSIEWKTQDQNFDYWTSWVMIQPILRRIWGCSFLPDHDYGKGGKGWRDLWQDLLSLILIEPENIRENLINNFKGVRIDGSNATIIGSKPGEFIADRNAITRVWMDHGVWPFMTTLLYINQTGDLDILFEPATYFRDPQLSRTYEKDSSWNIKYGHQLKTRSGKAYTGTILEHILVQNLVQFFNVGEHNLIRLESADWNDGLDMAFKRGESAAFMAIYGGNLLAIADLLEEVAARKNLKQIKVAMELMILMDSLTENKCDYDSVEQKKKLLFDIYFKSVQPELSGEHLDVTVSDLVQDLRKKGQWIFEKIRKDQRVSVTQNSKNYKWFNGYYDDKGERVEGTREGRVRMTLTGQVFPIMSGLAKDSDIKEVVESVNRFLKDKELGGFRLNTDFGVNHYLDLGRAFSFAYGTKENGAFFSHMNVMYSFALYKQGFVKEGYEVLQSIYKMCADREKSKIYPGIPEYFDSEGRGMYHYLTGSASWLVLTLLTEVFGVRGQFGDLVLAPKLLKEQFGKDNQAQVSLQFAGKKLTVTYVNKDKRDFGQYQIKDILLNNKVLAFERAAGQVRIKRDTLVKASDESILQVILG